MQPRLTRSRTDRMIGGVCGGLGHYFGVDPVIVRLIFVVLALTTFMTPFVYPVLWVIMPEEDATVHPSMPLPPDARFDPMTGQPLPQSNASTGQTVNLGSQSSSNPQATVPPAGRNRTLGFLLLGFGAIVLLNVIGDALSWLFNVQLSNLIFPLLLIALGVYLLRKQSV